MNFGSELDSELVQGEQKGGEKGWAEGLERRVEHIGDAYGNNTACTRSD